MAAPALDKTGGVAVGARKSAPIVFIGIVRGDLGRPYLVLRCVGGRPRRSAPRITSPSSLNLLDYKLVKRRASGRNNIEPSATLRTSKFNIAKFDSFRVKPLGSTERASDCSTLSVWNAQLVTTAVTSFDYQSALRLRCRYDRITRRRPTAIPIANFVKMDAFGTTLMGRTSDARVIQRAPAKTYTSSDPKPP